MRDAFDNMTTLYYGMMHSQHGFISMPIICEKNDAFAVVQFKTLESMGSFSGYVNACGYESLENAKKALNKQTSQIYSLSATRPETSTLVSFP